MLYNVVGRRIKVNDWQPGGPIVVSIQQRRSTHRFIYWETIDGPFEFHSYNAFDTFIKNEQNRYPETEVKV